MCEHLFRASLTTETLRVATWTFSSRRPCDQCVFCGAVRRAPGQVAAFERWVAEQLVALRAQDAEAVAFAARVLGSAPHD